MKNKECIFTNINEIIKEKYYDSLKQFMNKEAYNNLQFIEDVILRVFTLFYYVIDNS